MSPVEPKNMYGLTCTRFGHRAHMSSLSSIMATISSPQGNTERMVGSLDRESKHSSLEMIRWEKSFLK